MRRQGYTIVELITVMVILGILAAIAVPRMMSSEWNGLAWRQEVLSALRYAQKSAVGHRRVVCANVSAKEVTLTIAAANPTDTATPCPNELAAPDNRDFASNNDAVKASGKLGLYYFQPDGRITSDSAGTASVATNTGITFTDADRIRIDGETGYVN